MSDFLLSLLYSDEQILADYIMKNKISTSNLIFLKESDYSNKELSFKLTMRWLTKSCMISTCNFIFKYFKRGM